MEGAVRKLTRECENLISSVHAVSNLAQSSAPPRMSSEAQDDSFWGLLDHELGEHRVSSATAELQK